MNERWNSEGLPRNQLKWALTNRSLILKTRREKRCIICCCSTLNEAALCDICWATLDEKELELATQWLNGSHP